MKRIIVYLFLLGGLDIAALTVVKAGMMPAWGADLGLVIACSLVGGLGGVLYCLRGVYLNACVREAWDDVWQPWYYIRPIVSHLGGAASYLFLRAGLLVLEAEPSTPSTEMGFLALAFIAGLNVDKFVTKIEDVAHATWGIERSRTSRREEANGTEDI